ncbi:289_t:CDS:2 [Entrophospora sp. SA101]|nr:289_t:CDS:2 [Entrophospora sp. SA101]
MDFDLHDLNKEVDLMCYLGNDIIGLCARFIMYDKRCEPPSSDKITQIRDSDEKYKLIDTFALKEVTQVIYIYIKRDKCDKWVYSPNDGFNINDPIKRLWKRAVNYVIGSMVEKPNNRTRYTPNIQSNADKIGTMLKIEMVTEIPMLILANITENDKHVLNLEIYGTYGMLSIMQNGYEIRNGGSYAHNGFSVEVYDDVKSFNLSFYVQLSGEKDKYRGPFTNDWDYEWKFTGSEDSWDIEELS